MWGGQYHALGLLSSVRAEEGGPSQRLLGQHTDIETGLYYNRHRYFDPHSGGFISQDPVGLNGGLNIYEFAANMFGWMDPLGLTCWSTARKNFWKSEAKLGKGTFSPANLKRMAQGKAPRLRVEVMKKGKKVTKDVSMELHHAGIPQRVGGKNVHTVANLAAKTPWQHEAADTFRHTGETLLKIVKGVDVW